MNSHDYLGAVLINGLWQAPLIALAGALLLAAVPRASASTRYAVWLTALFACAVFPLLTTPLEVSLRLPGAVLKALEMVWLLGATVLLARTGAAAFALKRIKQIAYPLDVCERTGLTLWNRRPATYRDVRLCVSSKVDTPVAVGLFDALILLPQWLVDSAPPEELDRLAMHELAHLRRYDDWTKLLQNIIAALLFFNPAVRWIAVQSEVEREVSCDDAAVQAGSDAVTYAASLTRMARAVSWSKRFSLAPSLFAARRTLSLRVERLLAPRAASRAFSRPAATAYIGILLAAFFAVRSLTPIATQALTLPQDDQVAHAAAATLYSDLRAGRIGGTGFRQAERMLADLGPATNLRLNCILAGGAEPTYLYDVRTKYGSALLRMRLDHVRKVHSFTLTASGTLANRRFVRAFMTTEPSSSTS